MSKPKILVTGGAGFIGSNFCNHHASKYHVVALDNLLLGDPANLSSTVHFVEGDACDRSTLDKLVTTGEVAGPRLLRDKESEPRFPVGQTFDSIIHLAGTSSAPMFSYDIVKAYSNSITSFLEVLEFARRIGTKKVLYASTSSIYGNNPIPLTEDQPVTPPNHYAVTKHTMEEIAQCYSRVHGLDVVGFRFMSVYGPHEEHKGEFANLISQFIWGMKRGEQPIIYGDGEQTRDFTNVLDVVQGITLAMEHPHPLASEIFNIGTSKSINLISLVSTINSVLGTRIEPKFIPNPVQESYVRSQQADITKITTMLGYQPKVELKEGIEQIVKNLDQQKQRSVRDRTKRANQMP